MNHNQIKLNKVNKCFLCEESLDYYLYMCSYCYVETSYCFKCNKSLETLLNSTYFKCSSCFYLVKVTTRETCLFSKTDDLLYSMFRDREEARCGNFSRNNINKFEVCNKPMFAPNFEINNNNNCNNPTHFFQQTPMPQNPFYILNHNNNQQGLYGFNKFNFTNNNTPTSSIPGNFPPAICNIPKPKFSFGNNQNDVNFPHQYDNENLNNKETNFERVNYDNFGQTNRNFERGNFSTSENSKGFNPADNNVQMGIDTPEEMNSIIPKKENEINSNKISNIFSSMMQNQFNNGNVSDFNPFNTVSNQNDTNHDYNNSGSNNFNLLNKQFNFTPSFNQSIEASNNIRERPVDNNSFSIPNKNFNYVDHSIANNNDLELTRNNTNSNVQYDTNRNEIQPNIHLADKERLPNYSVLQSKSCRTESKNGSSTIKKMSLKNGNSTSEFAGYNKEESTLRRKHSVTPRSISRNNDDHFSNRLNQSEILPSDRNKFLYGPFLDVNKSYTEINLNNTVPHFNS